MWMDRVSFLTPTDTTRKAARDLKMGLFLTCLVFSLTACAQQSDLVKVEKDLGGKITKLNKDKKALAQVLKQSKQDIADARTALEQQKAELNEEIMNARVQLNEEIMKARAQLKSELRSLREENLPKVIDDLERQVHQVGKKLEEALQQEGQKTGDRFGAVQGSLGKFKEALAGVNTRLDKEGKRATSAETKMRRDFNKQQQAFGAKLDSDTQKLRAYLETEVKTAIGSINAAIESINGTMNVELAELRQTDTLHGKNLEAVTLSLTQLREVLGTTGTQLGTKLDSQGKGLEQTVKRIEQLQRQYVVLTKKLDADLKSLHGYLDKDVRPSLGSIVKAFAQEQNRTSQEFIKVKSGLRRVEEVSVSSVKQAQKQLEGQAVHVQELSEAVAGMRQVLDSMAGMLGTRTDQHMNQLGQLTAQLEQLEKARSAGAAQQASNTQAVSTHLNEVTASVQSIGKSFEQLKTLVNTKLNEQANQLQAQAKKSSKVQGTAAAVQDLQRGFNANVTQLNDLTESVVQLKDVVRAMGEKLGSKVDAHESQLIEVEQSLKQLKQPAVSEKPRSP